MPEQTQDPGMLRVEYVPLSTARLWEDNLKLHDLGAIIVSIEKHGFKDPPKYEPMLNGGEGGFIEGNGRTTALVEMKKNGKPAPRGVLVRDDGEWLIPVLFGVDAASEMAAKAYGIDHNATTLAGGDFDIGDHMRMWDDGFVYQLIELQEGGTSTASFDGDDIQRLMEWQLVDEPKHKRKGKELTDMDFWPVLRGKVSPAAFQKMQRLIESQGGDDFALTRVIEAIDESLLSVE